jgi:hypothetical protein
MSITLDEALSMKLQDAMRSGEGVQLPFPVVYFWAINGQASYKSQGGALYFGGFACKQEEMDAMVNQAFAALPAGLKQATIASRDGGEYEAYVTRLLAAAPIGFREAWIADGKRLPHYVDGGRQHIQILAYMAEMPSQEGGKLTPWGPVVLSAKGYQAKALMTAFRTWDKESKQARAEHAPGIPAWAFYTQVGTFEKERKVENVGRPGAQSPITPVRAYIPQEITEAHMQHLFLGAETVKDMLRLREEAAEWLEAWKVAGATGEAAQAVDNYAGLNEEIPF